jgi:23S rRNA pseudouridine1911/1915/1917 synthase
MAEEHRYRVDYECELLSFLISRAVGLSRKRAKDLLRFRSLTIQGRARTESIRHDTALAPGDIVIVSAGKPAGPSQLERRGLEIIHLDDAIVVIDKPVGLLSMGSEREKERTAHRMLNEHLKALTKSPTQQAFIVHRLDRETSGLMMFARNESVQSTLQRNWKNVTKKYFAIVEGTPARAEGTLKDHLMETRTFVVHRVATGGELAITHYRLLKKSGDKSLLEVTLETGRKHQIRVQLAAIGHPIVGDRKYGAQSDPARRLALHSCELKFRHPVSGASMEFRSALPDGLKKLIR